MLDREAIEEFFDSEFEYLNLEIPEDIPRDALVQAFYEYVETEVQEWLRDNFSAFFNDGEPDWDWIKEQIGVDEES